MGTSHVLMQTLAPIGGKWQIAGSTGLGQAGSGVASATMAVLVQLKAILQHLQPHPRQVVLAMQSGELVAGFRFRIDCELGGFGIG